jgi:hypothetical protein
VRIKDGTRPLADRYSFDGVAGQPIVIAINSADVDTYVYLLDANGSIIAQNDDAAAGASSRVPGTGAFLILPSTGKFTIEVTSFAGGAQGNYALNLGVPGGNCTFALSQPGQAFQAAGGGSTGECQHAARMCVDGNEQYRVDRSRHRWRALVQGPFPIQSLPTPARAHGNVDRGWFDLHCHAKRNKRYRLSERQRCNSTERRAGKSAHDNRLEPDGRHIGELRDQQARAVCGYWRRADHNYEHRVARSTGH